MRFLSKIQSGYLQDTRVMFENFQTSPVIKEKLLIAGYDDIRIREGMDLHAQAQTLFRDYLGKRQEKLARTQQLSEKCRLARKDYQGHTRRLRKELKNDPQMILELGLNGLCEKSKAGFTERVVSFYNKAMNNAAILEKIRALGHTPEKLQNGLNSAGAYVTSVNELERAKGECQRLVEDRNKVFQRLHDWVAAFVEACKVEFDDSPQALEEIGIFQRNQRKPKEKEPVIPPTPAPEALAEGEPTPNPILESEPKEAVRKKKKSKK